MRHEKQEFVLETVRILTDGNFELIDSEIIIATNITAAKRQIRRDTKHKRHYGPNNNWQKIPFNNGFLLCNNFQRVEILALVLKPKQ